MMAKTTSNNVISLYRLWHTLGALSSVQSTLIIYLATFKHLAHLFSLNVSEQC